MTSTDDQPLSAVERYDIALKSSNLRMQERSGDLDVIIAAGCLDDTFAATMMRLQHEYDGIRAEHRAAELRLREREALARRQKDAAGADGKVKPGSTAAELSASILKEAEGAALTAHALILVKLTTLRAAKEMMGHFALRAAGRLKFDRDPMHILRLSGSVLDVFISPKCRACTGTGFLGEGEKGAPRSKCRPCKGTGFRREQLGKDEADRDFAGRLFMELESLMAGTGDQLQRKRHAAVATKALITGAEARASRG